MYKGVVCILKHLKKELSWATDKQLDKQVQIISNIMLHVFTTVIPLRSSRNKVILSSKQYHYVVLSNVFQFFQVESCEIASAYKKLLFSSAL